MLNPSKPREAPGRGCPNHAPHFEQVYCLFFSEEAGDLEGVTDEVAVSDCLAPMLAAELARTVKVLLAEPAQPAPNQPERTESNPVKPDQTECGR